MIFARKAWRVLVAIKDGLALVFLLLFFLVLFAALSNRPAPGKVHEGALLLKLDGAIVEEPKSVDPIGQLLSQQAPSTEYRARDLARALRSAAQDKRIKAVVLDLDRFTGAGQVHLQDIGRAMDSVRAAGKPVLTFAMLYSDDAILLAAHSSEVWVDPMGGALVMGPGGKHVFFGGLLDRLKIKAHVFRVGTFKSAVEPYIRNDFSPESRANTAAVYGSLFEAWKADVLRARPKANIALATTDPAAWIKASGGDAAKAALSAGLVDRIGDRVAFGQRVAQLAGPDSGDKAPGAYAHTPLRAWLAANPESHKGKAIGVVTIAGEIVDAETGPGTASGKRIAKLLDKALDDDLAALVVRVDSPGGSIFASEQIRTAIERHKTRKIPVVVSMANLAASGGYWVSTPGTRIFADPATITGSIGVYAVVPTFEQALGQWGVTTDGVLTTPLSGQPDVIGGLGAATESMLQANVENAYARFLGVVAASRGKSPADVNAMAQGQVWDGGTARQKDLVDQFGGLDDALAYAAGQAKLEQGNWHPVFLGADESPYASLLERMSTDEDSAPPANAHDLAGLIAVRQQSAIAQAMAGIEGMLGRSGAQALCLECPAAPGPQATLSGSAGFFVRLQGFFARI
jgi:protease-4